MSISCVPNSHFVLSDFRGFLLTLDFNKNPVLSALPNTPITLNQQWSFTLPLPDFETTLVNAFSITTGEDIVLGWNAADGRTLSSFQQAIGIPSASFQNQLLVTCINNTAGFIRDLTDNYSLTAWHMETTGVGTSPPVTFNPFKGRAEQMWSFEALD